VEVAQFDYVAGHFPVNVVDTLIDNFELSADVFKIFHLPNWAWNACRTDVPFQSPRSCWSRGSRRSWRPLKPSVSFFTFGGFQVQVLPFMRIFRR
jgi:hypothetical protein